MGVSFLHEKIPIKIKSNAKTPLTSKITADSSKQIPPSHYVFFTPQVNIDQFDKRLVKRD